MNISFKNEISANYMVIENVKGFSGKDFPVRMVTENRIPGLLRFDYELLNGKADILYDISSLQFFNRAFEFTKMSFDDIKQLLYALNHLLKTLSAYLLDADNVVLKKECIFLDSRKKQYQFCYFPYYGGNFILEARELFAELLSLLDYNDRKAVRLAYDLQKASLADTFTFETAIRILETVSVETVRYEDAAEEPASPVLLTEPKPEKNLAEAVIEDSFFKKAGLYFKETSPQDIFDDINELKIVKKIRNFRPETAGTPAQTANEALQEPTKTNGNTTAAQVSSNDLPPGILNLQKTLQD